MRTLVLMVIVLTSSFDPLVCVKAQQEEARVQRAADRFIKRFRQTLDFGTVFDEMFVQDAMRPLRKAEFFQSMNLAPQLIDSLEDPELERFYKAILNYFYLRAVYDLAVGKDDKPPPNVDEAAKVSKFRNVFSDKGSGDAIIATRQEFDDFIKELANIAALYKRHLTPKVFASTAYKSSVEPGDNQVQITDFLEGFGVAKGTKVYHLDKDIFQFYFMEEKGQFKVVYLSLGN